MTTPTPTLMKTGTINAGGKSIDVAVLSDKTRIIISSEKNTNSGISGMIENFNRDAPLFLKPHLSDEPIKTEYKMHDGAVSLGYSSSSIASMAIAYNDYKNAMGGNVPEAHVEAVNLAFEVLITLAYIGASALSDEASGKQHLRKEDGLQSILNEVLH